MNDSIGAEVGYGGRALDDPTPDQGGYEPITVRMPSDLMRRARAAAEAETLAIRARGDESSSFTLNGILVNAVREYFKSYEERNGALPDPSPVKKKSKGKKSPEYDPTPEMKKYVADLVTKKKAREN